MRLNVVGRTHMLPPDVQEAVRRAEAQTRYTFLFSSSALAGAFGGLLAGAIGGMDGARGYRGWRWVFIIGE